MPTTEIVNLNLKPGSDIGDPNNAASAAVQDGGNTLSKQDGQREFHFGTFVEQPNVLQGFINWDSKQKHEEFMKTEAYGPFFEHLMAVVEGDPWMVHVDFKPEGGFQKAVAAPVTEVATFFFEGGPPADHEANAAKGIDAMVKDGAEGFHAYATGITQEEVEKEGVKGKAAVLIVGWESVEAHMKLRETQTFKDNIHYLRGEAKKIEMHHTQFMNLVPS